NPENYFAEIEQAAFSPASFVPGIAARPDKMLQARIFSYADAHRYRIGVNHADLPVNRAQAEVNSYHKDGGMRYGFRPANAPVYAPNSFGGPAADAAAAGDEAGWHNDGELVRVAHTLHPEDDDFGQPGTLFREVFTDAERERMIANVTGHVGATRIPEIRERAIQYWKNVDAELGARVEAGLAPIDEPRT